MPVLASVLLLTLSGCTTEPAESAHTTVTVILDQDVTPEQKSAVEQRLRSMPSVEGVAFETREQAYARQKETLEDEPDLLAQLNPEYVPESFHATVTDPLAAEAIELVMGTVDQVGSVVLRIAEADPLPSRIGVIVRMEATATAEQLGAVERAVRALPHAESVEAEKRDAAYERLREQCQGKGDLATQLDRQSMRDSVRFELPLDKKSPGMSKLIGLDGVDVLEMVPATML
ncbi:hypothetical protein D7147_07660 [Micromonospora musae]|uniref:FtsX extracellular domain-containing protein n=1 Tax=Micromonospora musae TaxID=1894970 RepID=A0ABX9RG06_9ACTN|nr:hypothetical protein D7147_07660 [Micromonospora musae]